MADLQWEGDRGHGHGDVRARDARVSQGRAAGGGRDSGRVPVAGSGCGYNSARPARWRTFSGRETEDMATVTFEHATRVYPRAERPAVAEIRVAFRSRVRVAAITPRDPHDGGPSVGGRPRTW